MSIDAGIKLTFGTPVPTPLPTSWLGRREAPPGVPTWASNPVLTSTQIRLLIAQIGYDKSQWDYSKIGEGNLLGRYQFNSNVLEGYGLLAPGSNAAYGSDCVNYTHCWSPGTFRNSATSYSSYLYNTTNLMAFLSNSIAQEHLAYQYLSDIYINLTKVGAIKNSDQADTVGGMMYVGWNLGTGTAVTHTAQKGTGAYAWRFNGDGAGADAFVSGKYAVGVLSL